MNLKNRSGNNAWKGERKFLKKRKDSSQLQPLHLVVIGDLLKSDAYKLHLQLILLVTPKD